VLTRTGGILFLGLLTVQFHLLTSLNTAVVGLVTGTVGSVLDLAGTPVVADLVSNTISSVLFVFLYGIMAAAYLQVRDDEQDGFDGTGTSQSTDGAVVDP